MKMHDKAVLKIVKLRQQLSALRSATVVESNRITLSALIDEVDKLPSIAADLFADEPVRFRVQGPRSFPFADLQPGGHFDVEHDRVNSLRACASTFARRHGITLTVREKPNGGARCVRIDGVSGQPAALADLQPKVQQTRQVDPAPAPAPRPAAVAPSSVVHPFDQPERIPERTAFHAPRDRAIEDPQTADDVRQAMEVPEDERTEWQQFVVDEYQHLIEFEAVRPNIIEVIPAYTAKLQGDDLSPRQKWLADKYGYMLEAGWDGVTHTDGLAA